MLDSGTCPISGHVNISKLGSLNTDNFIWQAQ